MIIKTLNAFTMRDATTGKLTSFAFGEIASVTDDLGNQLISDGLAEQYQNIVPYGIKNITENGTYDVSLYATANVQVGAGLNLTVSAVADDVDLLGKLAGDLQSNIAIAENTVSGTLNYVTGYTGFSSDETMQSGNYLALLCEAMEGATITVEVVGGVLGHPVTLDDDGMIVLWLTDTTTESIQIIATLNNVSETLNLSIADLVLSQE